jgi:group I intron endonuclease
VGIIYIARNTVNGKCYIGKTVRALRTRMQWHVAMAKRGGGWCFHNAIRKYGTDAFEWSVLCECGDGELDRLEREHIVIHGAKRPGGYNLTDGGDGVVGRTPEVMERIAAFHRGRKRSAETRRRLSEAMAGKKTRLGAVLSDETKKKISESLVGRCLLTEEAREKISVAMRGRPKTPEQRAKTSEALKRIWADRRRKASQGQTTTSLYEEP